MQRFRQILNEFRSLISRTGRRKRHDNYRSEPLEVRALLASVMDSGSTLQIELDANEGLQIASAGTQYEFTSTNSVFSDTGVAGTDYFSSFGTANLTLNDLAQYTHIEITDAGDGASVEFLNSGTGDFQHHLDVVFDELANPESVLFNGVADFSDNSLTVNSSGAVILNADANLSVHDGDISITAVNQSDGTIARRGIDISGATITTSGSGDIQLTGTGVTSNPNINRVDGIRAVQNSVFESTSSESDAGSILFNGTGGGGTAFEFAVNIEDSTISSVNGDINVTGAAGVGTEHSHYGIVIKRTTFDSTGTGSNAANVSLDGTGGTAVDFGIGTLIQDVTIRTVDGDVSISGRGGSGTGGNNQGGRIRDTLVQSIGTGADAGQITVSLLGGTGTHASGGGLIQEGTRILSADGRITISGDAGPAVSEHGNGGIAIWGVVRSSGTAPIGISGAGKTGGSFTRGVEIVGDEAIIESVNAPITITGTAGSAPDGNGDGVEIRSGAVVTSARGDVLITGTAADGEVGTNRGVRILSGAQVRSTGVGNDAATITIDGTGGVGENWNLGVDLNSGVVETIDGDISLTGRGGRGTAGNNRGVQLLGGTVRSTGTGANAADIDLIGFSGSGVNWNIGVAFTMHNDVAGQISSVDGNINIVGTPNGTVSGTSNHGVWIELPISATGTGNIDIDGTANTGTSFNRGVHFRDTNAVTSSGNLTIKGVGGLSAQNRNEGVVIDENSSLTTSDGLISVFGTSGSNNSHGVEIWGTTDSGGRILAGPTGSVEIRATGLGTGEKDDFKLYENAFIGGNNSLGDISIVADTIDLDESSRLIGAGRLTIAPFSLEDAGQSITLGANPTASRTDLNLTDNELGVISHLFEVVAFGSNTADNQNAVTIDGITLHQPVEIYGGLIRDTSGVDIAAPEAKLGGRINVGLPSGVLGVRNGMITSGSTLILQIAGIIPGEGPERHDQVEASGEFNIEDGVNLALVWSPQWTPTGGEEIVIVRRNGGGGHFENLPEGTQVYSGFRTLNFYGATITYAGGDGDDIAIRIPESLDNVRIPRHVDLGHPASEVTTVFGTGENSRVGSKIAAAGDVDGDGYDDFLIAAQHASGADGAAGAGRAYLIYGDSEHTFEIDLTQTSARTTTFLGHEAADQVSDIDVGDINGDGYSDLVLGAAHSDGPANERDFGGGAYVVWGGPNLAETVELGMPGTSVTRVFGADTGDVAGRAVAVVGDINADGYDDFAIASPSSDSIDNSRELAGEATIIFGGPTFPEVIDLAFADAGMIRLFGAQSGDGFDMDVAGIGDINGDDIDDMAISFTFASGYLDETHRSGETYIIYGNPDLRDSIDLARGADVVIYGATERGFSGKDLAGAGDVNGDGFDDLMIGAPGNGFRADPGRSFLIWGGAALPAEIHTTGLGIHGVTFHGVVTGSFSGAGVDIAGDLNADGYDDIIIGTPLGNGLAVNSEGNNSANSGEVYIILGGTDLAGSVDLAQRESYDIVLYGADFGDHAGSSVAVVGDVDKDGFQDLVVGAPIADSFNNRQQHSGEAYLISGESLFQPAVPIVTRPVGRLDRPTADITWTEAAGATSYELWLERIGADDNPVVNPKSVLTTSYDVNDLAIGRYRAWVRANRSDGSKSAWRANAFSVTADTTVRSITESDNGRPEMTWDAVEGASAYRVYVSNVTQQQNAVIDTTVTGTTFVPSVDLTFGLHRIWVQPIGPGNFAGSWSRHADYNVSPQPVSPVSTLNARPTFSWNAVDGVESVQIYIQVGPIVVVNESGITGNSYTPDIDLEDGFYRWWVRATATNGRAAGWSKPGTLSIGNTQITGPDGVTDGFANITWLELPGDMTWEVYLYSDSDRSLIQRVSGIQGESFQSTPLPEGHYRVWVRGTHNETGQLSWSRPHSFFVEAASSVTASPVEPRSPTFDATPTFRWNASVNAGSFNLYLTNGEIVINETGLTTAEWTPTTNLSAGPWRWQVQAVTSTGEAGSWSQAAFTDTSARAVLLAVNGDSQPTLQWSTILGAARYVLQINNRDDNSVFIREENLTDTSFTAPQTVAAGNYRVWVRAIATDGSLGPWSGQFDFEVA